VNADNATPTDPGFAPLDRRQALFPDWTPENKSPHNETVEIYSNCEEVELVLNGRSLGAKPLPSDASPRVWTVPFEPGEIKAVAKNGGKIVARRILRTAGSAEKIELTSERADDVIFVRAAVVDAHGVLLPSATNSIHFETDPPNVIAAVDSADNSSHESFQSDTRRAFEGECFAIVKAERDRGKIKITAFSDGLKSASLTIR
jgi:beta-galactosidase